MSKWMISHALATIITPIFLSLILSSIVAIYTGNSSDMFAGAWMIMYVLYLFLFIMFPILLFFQFLRVNEGKGRFMATPIIISVIGIVLYLVFLSNGIELWPDILFIVGTAIIYTTVMLCAETILEKWFQITNEDIA